MSHQEVWAEFIKRSLPPESKSALSAEATPVAAIERRLPRLKAHPTLPIKASRPRPTAKGPWLHKPHIHSPFERLAFRA